MVLLKQNVKNRQCNYNLLITKNETLYTFENKSPVNHINFNNILREQKKHNSILMILTSPNLKKIKLKEHKIELTIYSLQDCLNQILYKILLEKIHALPKTIETISVLKESLVFSASKYVIINTNKDSIVKTIPLQLNGYGSSIKLYYYTL